MHAPDFREEGGEDVEAHRHAAHQAQRAAQRLLLLADGRDGVLQILEDAVTQLQERFTRGRDADAPADAMEDRLAELFFEQQNLPADRRLRDVKLFARGGEGAGVGDGADDLQLPQIHAESLHNLNAWTQGNV